MKTYLSFWLITLLMAANAVAQDVSSLTDEQMTKAIEESNKRLGAISFWRSDELGVSFGYDERWKPVTPIQKSSAAVINWLSKKSGGLVATCYLEVHNAGIGKLGPDEVKQGAQEIVDAYLRNGRLHDPNLKLVNWRLATQDNYPVVYMEHDMSITNLNGTFRQRIYSEITSWRGREINFECASTIPIDMPKASGLVEGPIKNVMGTLLFNREAH